ncbi:MAG: non-heme iron oxygenase ferredoxin subunit [Cyanobacteria bacterium]|nr:non-heme iron oxygenase ferredoxin subunit [Cyanobacteriota bacterium]
MTDQFQKIANVSEVPDGQARIFEHGDESIALCNVSGHFYAVANRCSHDDGPLGEGELIDSQIECPRHGARFDLETGKALCLPAVTPIPVWRVEVRGEEVWIGREFEAPR